MLKSPRLARSIRSFTKDNSGNFAVMFACMSSVIVVCVAMAVDYTRMVSTRSQLGSALDSALLSAAQDLAKGKITKAEAEARAKQFFAANLSAARFPEDSAYIANFEIDPVDSSLSADAKTNIKLFAPIGGFGSSTTITANSGADFAERKIEVSMVLDVTGSMADYNKMNDLKVAAKIGVAEFLANNAGNTRVAIVPYSFGVNAGALSKFVVDTKGKPAKDACATERRGAQMFSDASPVDYKVTRADTINYAAPGYTTVAYNLYCPANAVQPLTKNAATLNSVINGLSPVGGTAGQIGLQWGWYMLSPAWKGVLPAASEPAAANAANVEKYLILMTDGLFNSEASGLKNSDVPTYSGISQVSGRLAMTYCNAMKAQKVKIFTIGFRLKDIGDKAQQDEATKMLRDCATSPTGTQQTFYDAENGAELTSAFQEIAKRVEVVRLTN